MDIVLNDGTLARNVTVWEYEQLKEKGLVGQNVTMKTNTCDDRTIGPYQADPNRSLLSAQEHYFRCWMCGCTLDDSNRSSQVFMSNPPKYACIKCCNI